MKGTASLVVVIAASMCILISVIHLNSRAYSPFKASLGRVQLYPIDIQRTLAENVNSSSELECKSTGASAELVTLDVCDETIYIVVDKFGFGNYRTVQEAIDYVPEDSKRRIVIQIKAGVYLEKVYIGIMKTNITLHGDGAEFTHISWNDTAATVGSTRLSASVIVDAPDFIARDISFHNFADPPVGSVGAQAVAVSVSGDRAAFYRCRFYGNQDTLLDEYGRHYFKQCFIEGTVDFIFGFGQSLYEQCELHSVAASSTETVTGSIAAHGRQSADQTTGFSFVNCSITGTGRIYLGRAWGTYSRVVYSYTEIADIITPEGWSDWSDPTRDRLVYFGEYKCTGPGADDSRRVNWSRRLSDDEAAPFLSITFIDGDQWLKSSEYCQ